MTREEAIDRIRRLPKGGDWDEGMIDMLVALGVLKLDVLTGAEEYELAIEGQKLMRDRP